MAEEGVLILLQKKLKKVKKVIPKEEMDEVMSSLTQTTQSERTQEVDWDVLEIDLNDVADLGELLGFSAVQ
ncbi:hypothetical protein AAF712_016564 [Marasmius tenuissimus]|uniref:Uncharacterized protein n=1 Tax=Marasmius tenuissimus TaxID=585030 RepID=A0ABR2Z7P3_9AGAR